MLTTAQVSANHEDDFHPHANHEDDFHPHANHMSKLKNFTKGEIHEFSAFPFSLHLMFDQTFSSLTVC